MLSHTALHRRPLRLMRFWRFDSDIKLAGVAAPATDEVHVVRTSVVGVAI